MLSLPRLKSGKSHDGGAGHRYSHTRYVFGDTVLPAKERDAESGNDSFGAGYYASTMELSAAAVQEPITLTSPRQRVTICLDPSQSSSQWHYRVGAGALRRLNYSNHFAVRDGDNEDFILFLHGAVRQLAIQ